jgi:hypothetical protein
VSALTGKPLHQTTPCSHGGVLLGANPLVVRRCAQKREHLRIFGNVELTVKVPRIGDTESIIEGL